MSFGATGVFPYANITPVDGTSPLVLPLGGTGNEALDAAIPYAAGSYQVNDRVWLGLAINAPYGLATEANYTSASQIYGRGSEVVSIAVSPTIGVQVNDWLAVGASVQGQYFDGDLTAANTPFPGSPGNELTSDGFALGFSLGVTLKPREGTEIGIGYRSAIRQRTEGDLILEGPLGLLPAGTYGIRTALDLPDSISVGVRQKLGDRFTLLLQYEYTNWSRFDAFPVYFTSGPGAGTTFTTLAFLYDDAHYFAVGGEYRWSENLTLAAGVGFQKSPINDTVRTVRLPDSDAVWLSAGAKYAVNSRFSIEFAYAHVFPASTRVDVSGPQNPAYLGLPYVGDVDLSANLISLGINYRLN